MDLDAVLARRLAVQHLAGLPAASVAEVVGGLLAVQAQDSPLARWSIAMRTGLHTDAEVRDALERDRLVRTHVLRPTWHLVRVDDLRWLLDLTSPKVISSMAAQRHRLDLDDPTVVAREHEWLAGRLAGGTHLTRRELARADMRGERLGVLLLLAELKGLICSGPLDDGAHTYALVDERVPAAPAVDREDAVRELVLRFFAGHGPASVAHLVRWTTLTTREIKAALAGLGDHLVPSEVEGVTHWYASTHAPRASSAAASSHLSGRTGSSSDPGSSRPSDRAGPSSDTVPFPSDRTMLLPVFDEAYLSYPGSAFPRVADHPWGSHDQHFAEAGGGVVISGLRDVGWWRRRDTAKVTTVAVGLAASLGAAERSAVEQEAEALAAFTGRRLELMHASS